MKKLAIICAGLLVVSAPQAQAQAFSGFTANNDGAEFWDNLSDDGLALNPNICNSGYVVTGVAPSTCINQRPNTWLPYTGAAASTYWNLSGAWAPIIFNTPGLYSIELLSGTSNSGGDVAGANLDWGLFNVANRTGDFVNMNTAGVVPFSFPMSSGFSFGLWVDLLGGGRAYSDVDRQFALFGFGRSAPNTWIAGIEDNARGDFDYQDMMFRITTEDGGGPQEVVPEPATMTLLATGLAGMAAASRRRRKQK